MQQTYLDCLAELGVGGAHPGGLKLTKEILTKENITESTTILEAGCGTGQTAAYIAKQYGCQVTAIDFHEMMVKKAKARFQSLNLPIVVKQANTENLPFDNKKFDMILSESVMAFTDAEKTIQEFSRTLQETGTLHALEIVLEDEIPKHILDEISEFYEIPRFRTSSEWETLFKHAGFNQIQMEKYEPLSGNQDVESTPEFSLSGDINDQMIDILGQHEQYMNKYKGKLGYRIFRCTF